MVKIAFIGDISFNDGYIRLFKDKKNPFSGITDILKDADLVVGNLECTAKGNKGVNLNKKPRLSTDIETLNYLGNLNIGLTSLATNHIYDNLDDGFYNTINFLKSKNIEHVGCSTSKEEKHHILRKNINGISFCFFNYVTPDTNPTIPPEGNIYPSIFNLENCVADLKMNKDADYKIILIHWGGEFEGGIYPGINQHNRAKSLVNGGADLIIGHHSHTFQPYIKFRNKYIFYSLGNFCFDDIYCDGKLRSMSQKRLRQSAVVQINFEKKRYVVKLIPILNKKLTIQPAPFFLYTIKWRNLSFKFIKTIKPLWKLYILYFKKMRPIIKGIFRLDKDRSIVKRIREFKFSKLTSHMN